jgi:hypothetical protein
LISLQRTKSDSAREEAMEQPVEAEALDVDHTVRQYVKFIFDLTAAFQRGEAQAREPLPMIEAEARRVGALFAALPGDPAYRQRVRAGALCRYHFPEELRHVGAGEPFAAGFFWLAGQCAEASRSMSEGMDEREALRRMEAVLADFIPTVAGER